MNYQYIEQLLDRYWTCETTLEEEQILRSFFSQDDVPASLKVYAPLFAYEAADMHESGLSDGFEQKIMALIHEENGEDGGNQQPADRHDIRPMRFTLTSRLAPLMKAAAVVAVVVAAGNIAERTLQQTSVGQAVTDMTANDTYIKQEDITAKIKIIDRNKSLEAIAKNDSINEPRNMPVDDLIQE